MDQDFSIKPSIKPESSGTSNATWTYLVPIWYQSGTHLVLVEVVVLPLLSACFWPEFQVDASACQVIEQLENVAVDLAGKFSKWFLSMGGFLGITEVHCLHMFVELFGCHFEDEVFRCCLCPRQLLASARASARSETAQGVCLCLQK